VEDGIVDVIDGGLKLVVGDGEDQAIFHPSFVLGNIGGLEFFALMCGGAGWDDRIMGQFVGWDYEWHPIASKVDGWFLEEAQVALAMSPGTGDCHEICSEFAKGILDLLMGGFSQDPSQDGMRHLSLDTIGGNSIGHRVLA
jgi:hypothetical protein